MLGQGGYQILDYREFTSENYEKIYNLITTNKMYLIEHFKTDEVEEISLFLTAIKNENDITFLYNNKTQTLVYTKSGITNNLAQGGGSEESKYKIINLGTISNGTRFTDDVIKEIMSAYINQLIFSFYFTYERSDYQVVPLFNSDLEAFIFYIPTASINDAVDQSIAFNDIAMLSISEYKVYIYEEDITKCINIRGNSLEVGSLLKINDAFDMISLLAEDRYSLFAYVKISTEGLPTTIYYTPIIYYGTDTKAYMLICGDAILMCSLNGTTFTIVGTNKFLNPQQINFGEVSLAGGSFESIDAYSKLSSAIEKNILVQCQFSMAGQTYNILPYIYEQNGDICSFAYINAGISFIIKIKNDDTYTVDMYTDFLPTYSTLQVSGIESIAVNSSITTSIQSLTNKNTIITSIKPSVAGVIISAPYFDETDSCYKTTIFNATTSAVSDLTLTIDYCRLIKD